ncbi:MAG: hypothetical protein LBF51_02585 [Zoogloeaceae bacterium]|nr:hypothetical protein [Zoogloeaceae bacterium]
MAARREKGAVLVTGLILLVMVMMLGVAAMRTITLQERLAGASVDYTQAFQAAEAALRAGEKAITATPPAGAAAVVIHNRNNPADHATQPPAPSIVDLAKGYDYWKALPLCSAGGPPCATEYPLYGAVSTGDNFKNPLYIIEIQGTAPTSSGNKVSGTSLEGGKPSPVYGGGSTVFKVTAIGFGMQKQNSAGADPVSDVVLQTTITPPPAGG